MADELDYLVLPRKAVADGASTPDPGKQFALAWSTTFKDIAWWDADAGQWVNNNPLATPTRAGLISPEDFIKLSALGTGGQYPASAIENDSNVAGATIKDALETLETELGSLPDPVASLVVNDSAITGSSVKDALQTLGSAITAIPAPLPAVQASSGAADVSKLALLDAAGKFAVGFLPAATGSVPGTLAAADFTKLGTLGSGVATSSGATDSGKIAKLDAAGKYPMGFIPSLDMATLGFVAAPAKHYYLSTTGSDVADGLTQGTAKKTFANLHASLPRVITGPIVVHFGAGSFLFVEPTELIMFGPTACLILMGDTNTVVASGVIASGSYAEITSQTTTMTADQYVGMTMQLTSGTGIGNRRHVCKNTSSTIRVSGAFALDNGNIITTIPADTTYDITRPATSLTINTALQKHSGGNRIHFFNLSLDAVSGGYFLQPPSAGDASQHFFVNVELGNRVTITARNAKIYAGFRSTSSPYGAVGDGGQWDTFVSETGIKAAGLGLFFYLGICATVLGINSLSFADAELVGTLTGFMNVVVNAAPLTLTGGRISTVHSYNYGDLRLTNVSIIAATSSACITVSDSSIFYSSQLVEVSNSGTGRLIYMYNGARARVYMADAACASTTNPAIEVNNSSALDLYYTGATIPCGAQLFKISEASVVSAGGTPMVATQEGAVGSTVSGASRLFTNRIELTSTSGPALTISDTSDVTCSGAFIARTSRASGAVVIVNGGARLRCSNTSVAAIIQNTNTGVGTDGIQCSEGALASFAFNPSITVSGSSGYGANLRGGGRMTFPIRPTVVIGPTADFSLGPSVGDEFSDAAFSTSYSSITAGMSCAQRTT